MSTVVLSACGKYEQIVEDLKLISMIVLNKTIIKIGHNRFLFLFIKIIPLINGK